MNPDLPPLHEDAVVALLRDGGVPFDILRFAGRLHPMLVHFPIALLVVAALLEMLRRKGREKPARGAYACLAIAAAAGLLAALTGWLNAALEPHGRSLASTLTNHRWLGVGTASAALVAFLFATMQRFGWAGAAVPYRVTLLLAALLVLPTGHLGGTLVFGKDYLTEVLGKAPRPVAAPPPAPDADATGAGTEATIDETPAEPTDTAVPPPVPAAAPDDGGLALWRDEVRAIFEARCVECHGPDKRKAGLRLDRLDEALHPEVGVIAAGDAEGSYLFELVSLPADDPDLMPAKGEPLTADEQDVIRRWIEAGAAHDTAAGASAEPGDEPQGSGGEEDGAGADGTEDDDDTDGAPPGDEEASISPPSPDLGDGVTRALAAVAAAGGRGQRVGLDSGDVEVSFSRAAVGDEALESLAGLEEVLVAARLDRTEVTDAGVAPFVARFPRLARLDLSGTAVGDVTAGALAGHPALVVVNLYETRVTDDGVARLADAPALEKVYLWGSEATEDAVEALRAARPALRVEFGDLAAALAAADIGGPPDAPAPAAATPAPCCAAAASAGRECDHPCCVAARAAGEAVCTKCGGVAGA